MEIKSAQQEMRSVFQRGSVGQMISEMIWLVSAALGTWRKRTLWNSGAGPGGANYAAVAETMNYNAEYVKKPYSDTMRDCDHDGGFVINGIPVHWIFKGLLMSGKHFN